MRNFTCLLFAFFATFYAFALPVDPQKKNGKAVRLAQNIVVDGKLNETAWNDAETLVGFTQSEPNPGLNSSNATEVKIAYDDNAVYVSAKMAEVAKDSILRELSQRDELGNTDWFAFIIDAYKDGQNGVGFVVTASGVQLDTKYSVYGEDVSWNTVWQSAVQLGDKGWTVEMRIPYSALRFPNQDVQQWHVNFIRYTRRIREKSSWNFIDPTINGFLNQSGLVNGIEGIKPPVRLQLFPYVSAYYNTAGKQNATAANGGLDVKYGLNDAFTLDMTLIPDFGQVQSDNQVLNLSPFEVRFQENRQFFTEGTELFNKGDLFYSRRVGEAPGDFYDLGSNIRADEGIKKSPSEVKLLNATKISGRNQKGLGIGVFNAVTNNAYIDLEDTEGNQRKVLAAPVTNYNVAVLDQNLKNNSYVTLINTSVLRNGLAYDANVSAIDFNVKNKALSYAISGGGAVSQQYGLANTDVFGNSHRLNFGKISGNFNFNVGYDLKDNKFDPNDLGFLLFNNTIDKSANASYDFYKPFGAFNRAGINAYVVHTTLYKPRAFNNFGTGINAFFILKSFHAFGGSLSFEPIVTYDYFEPRTRDYSRFYKYPINNTMYGWISTDYRKRFAFDVNLTYRHFDEKNRNTFTANVSPRFRVNNKLSFIYSIDREYQSNDVGFAVYNQLGGSIGPKPSDELIFAIRDRLTYTNILNVKYSFTNKSGLTFRLRHYWSKVKYDSFYNLDKDGKLATTAYRGIDANNNSYHDNSFNIFNIDMVYSWVFSPGSELRLVWKNSIFSSENFVRNDYIENVEQLFNQTKNNSFSVRFLYFLDYGTIRPRKAKI